MGRKQQSQTEHLTLREVPRCLDRHAGFAEELRSLPPDEAVRAIRLQIITDRIFDRVVRRDERARWREQSAPPPGGDHCRPLIFLAVPGRLGSRRGGGDDDLEAGGESPFCHCVRSEAIGKQPPVASLCTCPRDPLAPYEYEPLAEITPGIEARRRPVRRMRAEWAAERRASWD